MTDFEKYLKESMPREFLTLSKIKDTHRTMRFCLDDLKQAFEVGQKSNETKWIRGIPEHKFCNFLLIVKPEGCNYEHIVKAFYAEKFKIEVSCPDCDDGYDQNENEEYFLKEGFYEDSQWYNDEGLYFEIPEKDIIAWQPMPGDDNINNN